LNGGDASVGVRTEGHGVQGGDAVPGANLTGIDGVIAEVLVGDIAVLIADQAVVGNHIGIEIDLHLSIQRDHLQGGGQIIHKEFAGFVEIVYVGVVAIAVICQLFHEDIIQVAYLTD
jgi:hypothetical protein